MESRYFRKSVVAYGLNLLLLFCAGSRALHAQEIQVTQNPAFPTTTVGSTAAAQTISFQLVSATAISGVTVPKAQNGAQEFTAGAVSGCVADGTTVNASGSTCSVAVTFTPQYPGLRSASLLVQDGSTVLGAIGLRGTGGSSLAAYQTAASSLVALSGVINPVAIAVDGAGNLYVVDSNVNGPQVVKLAVGSSTPVRMPFSSLYSPGGIAVDAAGDVYVSDSGKVLELSAQGTQQTLAVSGLQSPGALAVDAAGSLYIADAGTNQIVKWTAAGVQSTLPITGLNNPEGVAVDAAGNVFVSDYFNDRVVKLPPSGSQSVVAKGLGQPEGLALDAAGDLYIADDLNQDIVQLPAGGTQGTMQLAVPNTAQTLGLPQSVAVDGAGNLYIDDVQYYQVYKIEQTQPHAAAFTSTQVGQTSFPAFYGIQNIGTQPLQITGYSDMTVGQSTSSFEQNQNYTTCSSTIPLSPGMQCDLGITFSPTVAGTLTGSVSVQDNSMNAAAPNNQQTIQASGTGTGSAPTPPPPTPALALKVSASTVVINAPGQSATVTITLTPSGGYAGTVKLACSGLPSEATCAFSPTSVTFTASSSAAQTITLTVSTAAAMAALRPYAPQSTPSNPMPMLAGAFWLPGLLAAGVGLRKRCAKGVTSHVGHLLVLLVLLVGVGLMTACGGGSTPVTGGSGTNTGGSTPTGGTPMGTSIVTVTASDGAGLNQTITFTLNVQ